MWKSSRRILRITLVWTIVATMTFDVALACRGRRRARRGHYVAAAVYVVDGALQKGSVIQKGEPLQKEGAVQKGAVQKGGWDVYDPVPPAPRDETFSDDDVPVPPEPELSGTPDEGIPSLSDEPPAPNVAEEAALPEVADEPVMPENPTPDLAGEAAAEDSVDAEPPLAEASEEEAPLAPPLAEPAGEPTDPLENLFSEPVERPAAELPAQQEPSEADPLENLFDEPAPAEAVTEEMPGVATDEPSGDVFENLFGGEPAPQSEATSDAPGDSDEPEMTEDLFEDLFGDPDSTDDPADQPGDALEDPFGQLAPPENPLTMRRWVDNTGNFEVNGRLIAILEGQVRLLKENGRTCTVPFERLSAVDLGLVQRVQAEHGQGLLTQLAGH